MKITIAPDGEVSIDTNGTDMAQVADLIAALQQPAPKKAPKPKAAPASETVPVSPQLVETWEWLLANDTAEGATKNAIAAGLGLQHDTAGYRINELCKKGLAYRVKTGHYRAGEKA